MHERTAAVVRLDVHLRIRIIYICLARYSARDDDGAMRRV